MSANQRQVGGSHYKLTEIQHWDFVELQGMGYLEAATTKYISRYRAKDGRQGLEKAIHYVEKLIELYHSDGRCNRVTRIDRRLTEQFFQIYDLEGDAAEACHGLLHWVTPADLQIVIAHIHVLLAELHE